MTCELEIKMVLRYHDLVVAFIVFDNMTVIRNSDTPDSWMLQQP